MSTKTLDLAIKVNGLKQVFEPTIYILRIMSLYSTTVQYCSLYLPVLPPGVEFETASLFVYRLRAVPRSFESDRRRRARAAPLRYVGQPRALPRLSRRERGHPSHPQRWWGLADGKRGERQAAT